MSGVDRERLRGRLDAELARFRAENPRSAEHHERARGSLLGGVPMPWMMAWAGGFPVVAAHAEGSRVTDVDGHEYVDLCLGDTGAMTGHGPPAVVARPARRVGRASRTCSRPRTRPGWGRS